MKRVVNNLPPLGSGQEVKDMFREKITRAYESTSGVNIPIGELSDGYHTFNELYELIKKKREEVK